MIVKPQSLSPSSMSRKALVISHFFSGVVSLAEKSFFRAPPALIFLYEVYLLFFFLTLLYFLYTSYRLFRGQRPVKKSLLVISSLSAVLWISPAILSFGNAITYLTNPNMPPDMKAHWLDYLWSFFSAIGIMNIASILYVIYHLRRPEKGGRGV